MHITILTLDSRGDVQPGFYVFSLPEKSAMVQDILMLWMR